MLTLAKIEDHPSSESRSKFEGVTRRLHAPRWERERHAKEPSQRAKPKSQAKAPRKEGIFTPNHVRPLPSEPSRALTLAAHQASESRLVSAKNARVFHLGRASAMRLLGLPLLTAPANRLILNGAYRSPSCFWRQGLRKSPEEGSR